MGEFLMGRLQSPRECVAFHGGNMCEWTCDKPPPPPRTCITNRDCDRPELCFDPHDGGFLKDWEKCTEPGDCMCRLPPSDKPPISDRPNEPPLRKCHHNKDCESPDLCYEVAKNHFLSDNELCNQYEGGCYCRPKPNLRKRGSN